MVHYAQNLPLVCSKKTKFGKTYQFLTNLLFKSTVIGGSSVYHCFNHLALSFIYEIDLNGPLSLGTFAYIVSIITMYKLSTYEPAFNN